MRNIRSLYIVLPLRLACLLAMVSLLAGCGFKAEPAGADSSQKHADVPAPKVDGEKVTLTDGAPQKASLFVETAEPRKVAITHLTGRLYWNESATVRVFTPVSGRVSAIRADLGEPISVGMPLAEIDSPDFGQALADARTSAGNLAAANKSFDRAKKLFEYGAAPQKDVEAAEAACIAAQAEHDRAQARLANYGGTDKSSNSMYVLRSPLTGVLVEKNINPGQEIRADQMLANATQLFAPLFIISDPTELWLQLDVAEPDLPSLHPGQRLQVYSRAYPDKRFDGTIEKIGDSLDPATRTIKVRCVVHNPERLLKAEMYALVDVAQPTEKTADAVEISAKAIFMKNNDSYLFVETSPGEYERKRVKLGIEKEGKVAVFEGVKPGEKVVTEGCLLLQALVESAG